MFKLDDYTEFKINSRKQIVTATNLLKNKIIKIEIFHNKNKINDIKKEYEIINFLNNKNCMTCPKVYGLYTVLKNELIENDNISKDIKDIIAKSNKQEFSLIEQEYIEDSKEYNMSDVLLSILEQKSLGVYQGDIKPANIRFDAYKKIAYLIDYDQSFLLEEKVKSLSLEEFIRFCDNYDRQKYNIGNIFRHFKNYNREDLNSIIVDNKLDLSSTSIMKRQNTTNTDNGIYHYINTKYLFANGPRDVSKRSSLLNSLEFSKEEKVLDVGCNNGLLCKYLKARGCKVTGIDNDYHIILLNKIMKNISGIDIEYKNIDIDYVEKLDNFDTIMLFSVFHHTRDQIKNAVKISDSCKRIILECRLNENGKQPVGKNYSWELVAQWRFNDYNQLINHCENIFKGFKLNRDLGIGSKNRRILEFIKQ